jgi:thiamine-monophosphate kinase
MLVLTGEFAQIEVIRSRLPGPGDLEEIWIGDDAAILRSAGIGWLLFAADTVVAGIHADLTLTRLNDLGWKAMACSVSDIAAMGGRPGHALVTVAGPPGTDLALLYDGLADAATEYRCPIVGGDLTNAGSLVVTVAVTGHCEARPVTRAGARPGDIIWVTGKLGAAAAGLRLFRMLARPDGTEEAIEWPDVEQSDRKSLLQAHARPAAHVAGGQAARLAGATAMIDVSDGLVADLGHVAELSGVGFRLDHVPVAEGATEDEALGGGDDLVLAFCAPESAPIVETFKDLGTPIRIGQCTDDPAERSLGGRPLAPSGWEHDW